MGLDVSTSQLTHGLRPREETRESREERLGGGGGAVGRTWSTAPSAVFPCGGRRHRVRRPGLPHGTMVANQRRDTSPRLLFLCPYFPHTLGRGTGRTSFPTCPTCDISSVHACSPLHFLPDNIQILSVHCSLTPGVFMSRYTRMLRKQAKAAAKAGHTGTNSYGKTAVKSSATLNGPPSEGVSTYIVAAGTNGSLVLHPLAVITFLFRTVQRSRGTNLFPSRLLRPRPTTPLRPLFPLLP